MPPKKKPAKKPAKRKPGMFVVYVNENTGKVIKVTHGSARSQRVLKRRTTKPGSGVALREVDIKFQVFGGGAPTHTCITDANGVLHCVP
jgi:hypothetical protein